MPKNVQWLRELMYDLKQDYGEPITYTVVNKSEHNIIHGTVRVTKSNYRIKKAIRLSTILQRKMIQDIAYLAANKNFTYGALFDAEAIVFLIDRKDLPRDIKIDLNNFFFSKHERLTIKDAQILEHNCGWLVTVHNFKGALPFEAIELSIKHNLNYQQEIINA